MISESQVCTDIPILDSVPAPCNQTEDYTMVILNIPLNLVPFHYDIQNKLKALLK